MQIPIEVSGRHIHLSQSDLNKLFGKNYKLNKLENLSQPEEFACEEKIKIETALGELEIRIIGPIRKQTQVEVSESDAEKLGINPPRKMSGDLANSLGIKLIGPKGEVNLEQGVILAQRHIHLNPNLAEELNLKDRQLVNIKVVDNIFDNTVIRINENFKPAMHIDTDEAIKAGIKKGEEVFGEIVD
jgi:putative phosphotransacetylase